MPGTCMLTAYSYDILFVSFAFQVCGSVLLLSVLHVSVSFSLLPSCLIREWVRTRHVKRRSPHAHCGKSAKPIEVPRGLRSFDGSRYISRYRTSFYLKTVYKLESEYMERKHTYNRYDMFVRYGYLGVAPGSFQWRLFLLKKINEK